MMPPRLATVAFAYLYPGRSQTVKRVTSWPGQAAHRHESKIPSIVCYDQQNIMTVPLYKYYFAHAQGLSAARALHKRARSRYTIYPAYIHMSGIINYSKTHHEGQVLGRSPGGRLFSRSAAGKALRGATGQMRMWP
jgi:hypothetical protein